MALTQTLLTPGGLPPPRILSGDGKNSLFESLERFTAANGVEVWMATDKGARSGDNQDRVATAEFPDGVTAIVADGMGGHAQGDKAAEALCRGVVGNPEDIPGGVATGAANMVADNLDANSGSCYAVAKIRRDAAGAYSFRRARGGDARNAVIHRNGSVTDQTRDQSLTAHLDEEEKAASAFRGYVDNAAKPGKPGNITEEGPIPLEPGDIVYLASDGVHGCVSPEEFVEKFLKPNNFDIGKALQALSDETTRRMNERATYKQEIKSGQWRANGGKYSDGYLQCPPKDNRSIMLLVVPGAPKPGVPTPQAVQGTQSLITSIRSMLPRWLGGKS